MREPIYFDYSATTPVDPRVMDAMMKCLTLEGNFGNAASRSHVFGWKAEEAIEEARQHVADLMHCDPREIVWTSGATESDNLALKGVAHFYQSKGKHLITSKIEHKAVLDSCRQLEREGFEVTYLDPDEKGLIQPEEVAKAIREDTILVSLMHVNNEIGNILDLKKVGELCHANDALFHTDAVQGVGHYVFDMKELPIDFLSAAAHKFHGPKGVGFSFIRKNSGLQPSIHGGSQERGLRAGTESVHNIVGMFKALEIAYANLAFEKKKILGIKKYFIKELSKLFPNIVFNGLSGSDNGSTFTLVNVSFPISKEKASLLDFHLDLKGIACSKGSACQSGTGSGSHVLNAIQRAPINDWPSLRFSFSIYNSKKEVDYLIQVFKEFKN